MPAALQAGAHGTGRLVIERARLVVRGGVQGVWYRGSMQREARTLGLVGWVRNRPDGAVEAEAAGAAETIDRLLAWARRGPPGARVDDVQVTRESIDAMPASGFEIRR
jgi:acylphosphatase